MKIVRNLFRILVGLVFVFSGFVKGVDPLGTVYRMDDYFIAFSIPWATAFSLYLTIFLCMLEFVMGVSLLFNLWIRKTAWILLPMMIYFTILTFFDAVYNIVPDCGCFGDAIKMTNTQTFLKNLLLMAMVIPIFAWRKKYRSMLSSAGEFSLILTISLAFVLLSIYCYRHLPLIDFMDWKTGSQIDQTTSLPVRFFVTYKNKKTGEEKEYVAPDYPWNDSVWMSEWVFKSQRVEDPNKDKAMALKVEDAEGNDITSRLLGNEGFTFFLISQNLADASEEAFLDILPLYKKAVADNHLFVCLTNSLPEEIKLFRMAHGTAFEYFNADDVVLKTMVRANPGLILLHNGVVVAKWHHNDFPSYEEVRDKFLSK